MFLEGWAPLLVFSGGLGSITKHLWREPEADQFARIAVEMGVPEEKILIENKSTNTGENVLFTKQLLVERYIDAGKLIVVQSTAKTSTRLICIRTALGVVQTSVPIRPLPMGIPSSLRLAGLS